MELMEPMEVFQAVNTNGSNGKPKEVFQAVNTNGSNGTPKEPVEPMEPMEPMGHQKKCFRP